MGNGLEDLCAVFKWRVLAVQDPYHPFRSTERSTKYRDLNAITRPRHILFNDYPDISPFFFKKQHITPALV
jgi:hypothetical protein